ncbi:MAG: formimidoylglutamase [Flavobacteriaceae bacterium]
MFEFLQPLESEIIEFINSLSVQHLGTKTTFYTEDSFPDLNRIDIAILGVSEYRGAEINQERDLKLFRKEFYKLYEGNWDCAIADLGDIIQGDSVSDTYFALNQVALELLKKDIVLVVIGGSQDLTYPLYRVYDKLDKMVNLTSVDSKFDFGNSHLPMTTNSYLAKIIMEEPNNLYNYSNIGYQTYFTSQEEIDLMDKMFFDSYRLGEVGADVTVTEPVLRNSDIVSVDLTSVQSAYTGNFSNFVPNGFTGKEICAISRYAGISDRTSVFGVFNSSGLRSEAILTAQIVWYFVEGMTHRYNEYPILDLNNCIKYIVSFENDQDLVFYKSEISQRWWLEIPADTNVKIKTNRFTLLPCSKKDYLQAVEGMIPERWWKEQKKSHSLQ